MNWADSLFSYTAAHVVGHPFEILASLAWLIVAFGSMWCVFSSRVRDTAIERLVLSTISICSFSRAFYVIDRGEVPLDAVATAVALAVYCLVIWWKHYIYLPKRRFHDFIERREPNKK